MRGILKRHKDFQSSFVAPRHVDVWVPVDYETSGLRYPVLYMHDGQNLFEPELSFGGVDWGVDQTVTRLMAEEDFAGMIVVGIWNTNRRIPEYMPEQPMEEYADERALARFEKTYGGRPVSDAYIRFLVEEVKPFVDRTYRSQPDQANTWIMGSSMGGLISLYALCERPEVFGAAACLSTSWTIGGRVVLRYMERMLPRAGNHRLYFDYGVEAQIARYEALQMQVNRTLRRAGYQRDKDWMTERFPGAAHDERAWRDRLDVPLKFLIGVWEPPE